MAVLKETIPFSFQEIYNEIVKRFAERGYDSYFEGSNAAVLSSIMAYLIQGLNYNTAYNVNESILTLATKRKNVIQTARILSYEPSVPQSTVLEITLIFFRVGHFKIGKFSSFVINGFQYHYLGNDIELSVEKVGETVKIQVEEGKLLRHAEYPEILAYRIDEKKQYIDIPFRDVSKILCEVKFFNDFGESVDTVAFTQASFNAADTNDDLKNKFFRRDDINTGNCRIYFQLGTAGTRLPPNARINLDVLRTSGMAAYYDGFKSGRVEGEPGAFCKIVGTGPNQPKVIRQAQPEESIESIKANAPIFYNSACRTVTVHDYNAIIKSHPAVKNIMTWGGEDDFPVLPGYLFFAAEPMRRESYFGIFTKIPNQSGNYNYKKDGEINQKGNLLNETNSIHQFFFNTGYKNIDTMFLNDGEVVSAEFNENGTPKNPGIFDLVDTRNLPALLNNLKNPIYINIDLEVKVKQYPFGSSKSEIRKKLYNKIREKIGEMERFEGEYIHSNLVRYLDSELGEGNGLEVKPYFSIGLNAKNRVMQFTENKEFSKLNCFYSKKYDPKSKNLAITTYFSIYSEVQDEVQIYFNKDGLDYVDEDYYSYKVTSEDVAQGGRTLFFKDPGFSQDSLKVKLRSYDGLSTLEGRDINLYNLRNKSIFFYAKVGVELTNIKVVLPRFVRVGDAIKISALYGATKAENELLFKEIKQSDLNQGYIMLDDINRGEFAGLVKPSDYKVLYYCNKPGLVKETDEPDERGLLPNQVLGKACSTFEQANQLTETQNKVFSDTETTDLYYNSYDAEDGTIEVRVWLPASATGGETLEINYAGEITVTTLTSSMINKKIIDIKVSGKQLDIARIIYVGKEPSIKILPTYQEQKNELRPIDDDKIQFSQALYENITEYTPSSTLDRRIQIKDSKGISFFINFNNKFDVRNLVANYDEEQCEIKVSIPNGSPLKYEKPYITLNNYRKPAVLNFNFELHIKRGDVYQKTQVIYCRETESKLTTDEGPGGAFIYLDLPIEKIFDDRGSLIIENLPMINLTNFKIDEVTYNFEELREPGIERIPNLSSQIMQPEVSIYVNTGITKDSVGRILPFHTTLEDFYNLDLSKVNFIRFPIFLKSGEDEELVGSYTILMSRNPYIRIKFRNDILLNDETVEFSLKYPSNNFKLIRNSIFRLRSIIFDDTFDYFEVRDMQRRGDFIPRDYGVPESDEQSEVGEPIEQPPEAPESEESPDTESSEDTEEREESEDTEAAGASSSPAAAETGVSQSPQAESPSREEQSQSGDGED